MSWTGLCGGIPNQCLKAIDEIEQRQYAWLRKAFASVELERSYRDPLKRAMTVFDLTSGEVAEMMGVSRQAVDHWLLAGPPTDRLAKIGVLTEIADILHYRLHTGAAPMVFRMESEAYGGRAMLEVFADDGHQWLLQDMKQSFDFNKVA